MAPLFLALAVLAARPAHSADREIVLATWGGSWGKAIAEQAIAPFEKASGVKVRVISGISSANLQMVAAQRANPRIDLIMSIAQDAVVASADGLTMPLDPGEIPNLANLAAAGMRRNAAGQPMFAGMWIYPYGIAYRTDKVPAGIKCWKDLWQPSLKNKVAVSSPKYMNGYFLLMANRIAGGKETDVAPGLEQVRKMGANLVAVADDSASQQRLLAEGEAWAAPMLSSTAYKLADDGLPVAFVLPCEGAPAGLDVLSLVKNGPNPADAKKFIDFYESAQITAALTRELKVTPLNRLATVTPEHAKYTVSEQDLARLVSFDEATTIKDKAGWQDAWDREISPMTRR
jgi:putative spermidine/putrescine transport system substrate-binding protein